MPTTKKTTPKRAGKTQRLDETPSSPVLVGEVIVPKLKNNPGARMYENPMGRPSSYTQEVADAICELITEGRSLRYICKQDGMPSIATIFKWQRDYPDFLKQYTRAKDEQADTNAEDLQEIVDEVRKGILDPQSARVAADILKWTSSKLKPKKYGDKLDLTSDGKQMPTPIISIAAAPSQKELT